MAEDRQKRVAAQEQLIKEIVRDALDAIDERGGDVFFLELVRDLTKILISKRPGFSPTYAGDQFVDSRCSGFKERIETFSESSEEECELYFVLAQLALGRGDVAGARRHLHNCLGTGITSFVEYAMAWHELRRLNAANPPPPEKKSEREGMTDEQPV